MENDDTDPMAFRKFAVSALLIKEKKDGGFHYQLKLDVILAYNTKDARARYGIECKDQFPEHGLREVLAVEVVDD